MSDLSFEQLSLGLRGVELKVFEFDGPVSPVGHEKLMSPHKSISLLTSQYILICLGIVPHFLEDTIFLSFESKVDQ
jgi:hypothetical protein